MSDIFSRIAEIRVNEAVNKGELEDLPGEGEALKLEPLNPFETREDRIFNKIMKNLGLEPVEVSLLKEMADIEQKIEECKEETERQNLKKVLKEMKIKYDIIMEARKRKR